MRIFAGCIISIVCILFFPQSILAERPFRQTHNIEIEVECIQSASEIIRELNGYNLESSVFIQEFPGRGQQSRADIIRRVDGWAFQHVQAELRNLGIVHSESEQAHFLGSQIMDVDVRISSISQEIDRLTILMAASDTLNLLLTIESRLNELTRQRNDLIGQRNVLISQVENPIITIRLFETPEDPPSPEPEGFGERVAARFTSSWRGTTSAAVSFFVFLVRISIPLIALGIAVAFAVWVHKLGRKWHTQRAATNPTESEEKETEYDETDI